MCQWAPCPPCGRNSAALSSPWRKAWVLLRMALSQSMYAVTVAKADKTHGGRWPAVAAAIRWPLAAIDIYPALYI